MSVDYLTLAVQSIPGLDEAERGIAALDWRKAEIEASVLANPPASGASVGVALATRLFAGEELPEHVGEQVIAGRSEHARRTAELEVITEAAGYLRNMRDQVIVTGLDIALDVLREHLAQLLSDNRELLTALRGASTAEEAVNMGPEAAVAWADLGKGAESYVALRRAQRELFQRKAGAQFGTTPYVELGSGPAHPRSVELDEVLAIVGELTAEALPMDWKARRAAHVAQHGPVPFSYPNKREHFQGILSAPEHHVWLPNLAQAKAAYVEACEAAYGQRSAIGEGLVVGDGDMDRLLTTQRVIEARRIV